MELKHNILTKGGIFISKTNFLKGFPAEVQKVFNDAGIVKTEIIEGKMHIYTYHDDRTEKIGKKLNKMGYIYKWYYDTVNEEESVLIGWTEIRKLI